jgi:tripartite-type tricarboxylate transporter receptor subunit TctC
MLAAIAGTLSASTAFAQGLPAKPLRVVVPFAPGGAVDTVARIVGERLATQIGQPVVVENKPGDNANIGAHEVVRAEADGGTLLLGANGLATNPSLSKRLPFDPLTDLVAVARVGYAPLVLVVPADSKVSELSQLIALAREKKGEMNYGSSAIGGSGHLAGELFKRSADIKALHVAYKGGAPALTDLIGGRLDFMLINPLEAAPHVASGRLRALAVATGKRIDALPKVPTFAEAGVPGFDATVWWGYMAPAKTPPAVVQRLSREILDALKDPGVQSRLTKIGAIVEPQPAEGFDAFLRAETRRWAEIIQAAGISYE